MGRVTREPSTDAQEQAQPRPGSPLRRREFRLYFIGNLASNSGTWLHNAALSVYLFNLTHSSFWVGLAGAALFIPVLLLALPAGNLADRTDRLRLLRTTQIFAGMLAVLLTVLVALDAANKYVVLAITAGLGVSVAVAIPALQSFIPTLVPREELSRAIGLNSITFNVARVIGPLAAAAALFLGAAWAFGLNAVSFFIFVVALVLIRRAPFSQPVEGPGRIGEGLSYAWHHRRTRYMLIAIAGLSFALDPISTLTPALVRSYGLPTSRAPFIFAAWGTGAVLGVSLGGELIRRLADRGHGWVGLAVMASGLIWLGTARSFAVAVAAALFTGWGYVTAAVAFTTTIHADVPDRLRGRVSALWTLAFLGTRAPSGVIDGAIADRFGPRLGTMAFAVPATLAIWFALRGREPSGPAPETEGPLQEEESLGSDGSAYEVP